MQTHGTLCGTGDDSNDLFVADYYEAKHAILSRAFSMNTHGTYIIYTLESLEFRKYYWSSLKCDSCVLRSLLNSFIRLIWN